MIDKIKYILKNFFVIGFLDSLLVPGTLNKLMEKPVKPVFDELIYKGIEELICWDLIAAPATPILDYERFRKI